ncbi:hypothetical protein IW262DRAFT_1513841 [Armillaria fumosa]|nr:hypothetical protein IW262DRAFT_1513841 [Armillaria fumosa]
MPTSRGVGTLRDIAKKIKVLAFLSILATSSLSLPRETRPRRLQDTDLYSSYKPCQKLNSSRILTGAGMNHRHRRSANVFGALNESRHFFPTFFGFSGPYYASNFAIRGGLSQLWFLPPDIGKNIGQPLRTTENPAAVMPFYQKYLAKDVRTLSMLKIVVDKT